MRQGQSHGRAVRSAVRIRESDACVNKTKKRLSVGGRGLRFDLRGATLL